MNGELAADTCPFCFSEKDERAAVCPVCNHHTHIPPFLREERDELLARRETLLAEIAEKEKRLAR